MTPLDALLELLERVGAGNGAALVSEEELSRWPEPAVRALKLEKLLVKASPAGTVACRGCEQKCTMPVHTLTHPTRGASSFVVCDKRDDTNRVPVPSGCLEQWRASAGSIAALITRLLGLRGPDLGDIYAGRWEIGMFKGRKHSSHMVLLADGSLTLCVAGHSIALADILTLENQSLKLDKQTLIHFVDRPVAGAGDIESAKQRRARLKKLVQAEKTKGNKAFLKTVAGDEDISVSRLKQLLKEVPEPIKAQFKRSAY